MNDIPGYGEPWVILGATLVTAALANLVLTRILQPLLRTYALARPNARSSHTIPTPQGGGIPIIACIIVISLLTAEALSVSGTARIQLIVVLAMSAILAAIGTTDDIRPLEALPRLLLQAAVLIVVVASLPAELRIWQVLPWWLERVLLLLGALWFVNLVNFMDGIDWMTVAEVVPLTAGLAIIGAMGALPDEALIVTVALCGAMIGFAPFNRPVARLFLGDVGSLPIGLLLAWLLILAAGRGYLVAALLLPLYYLADTTITLVRRLVTGEPITQAHRSHFYQRAVDAGLNVRKVIGRVFAANIVLVVLAILSAFNVSWAGEVAALAAGCAVVSALMWSLSRTDRKTRT